MGQPTVGEIRMFAGSFAPAGWAFCSGQLVPISENETLFNLIGTTYGGDGQETFAYPNLQGRVPMHMGQGPGISQNYQLAEMAGVEQVTLNTQQIPNHNHPFLATTDFADQSGPANNLVAQPSVAKLYFAVSPTAALSPNAVTATGGSQPHDNMQPYLTVSFIISLFGVFPTPS